MIGFLLIRKKQVPNGQLWFLPVICLIGVWHLQETYRFYGLLLLFAAAYLHVRYLFANTSGKSVLVVWALFFMLSFMPVDISLQDFPGHPRFIRYVKGLPSRELRELEQQGKIMLGGCVTTGRDPRYVLVW